MRKRQKSHNFYRKQGQTSFTKAQNIQKKPENSKEQCIYVQPLVINANNPKFRTYHLLSIQ